MSDNLENSCYFYRMFTLVTDIGTAVLLKTFYSKIPKDQVKTFFKKKKADFDSLKYRNRPVLTRPQYDLVTSTKPEPEKYDISLLICLLRNVCPKVDAPKKGWNDIPDAADVTLGAELLRFQAIRNQFTAHTAKAQIDKPSFEAKWQEIKGILIRIARMLCVEYEDYIEKLITKLENRMLDPKGEQQKKVLDAFKDWQKELTEHVQAFQPSFLNTRGKTHTIDEVDAVKRQVTNLIEIVKSQPTPDSLTRGGTLKADEVDAVKRQVTNLIKIIGSPPTLDSLTQYNNIESWAAEGQKQIASMKTYTEKLEKKLSELREEYTKLVHFLKEGKKAWHSIRVIVVGQSGVGKTELTRRLLNEHVDTDKHERANEKEIHLRRRCKISLKDSEWTVLKQDDKSQNRLTRLVKLMAQCEMDISELNVTDNMDESPINIGDDIDTEQDNSTSMNLPVTTKPDTDHQDTDANTPMKEDTINALYQGVIKEANNLTDSDYADLSILDFSGQYAFHAHQVFLSRRAVYLLVTDISKPLHAVVAEDKCYVDTGSTSWFISEYVKFWLNSIHEYCSSSDHGVPPVILVGTHADKLDQEKKMVLIHKYFHELRLMLKGNVSYSHLVDADFAINSKIEDPNLNQLKDEIFKVATQQQYWGDLLPARWTLLEMVIIDLQCEGLKICERKTLLKLNQALPVPLSSNEEIELFLRFHHDSGNIVYLSHEDTRDNILLDPQWLIDAFKCLIPAEVFLKKKPTQYKLWREFNTTGKLKHELIDVVWKETEFYDHRDHLLTLLEQLDIIARPTDDNQPKTEDFFIVPCALKHPPPTEVFQPNTSIPVISTSRLCFSMTNKAFPIAMFNRLIAACLTTWKVSTQGRKDLIFCGCGVFDVDRQHRLTLLFSQNVIQIWVSMFSKINPHLNEYVCMQVRKFIEGKLTEIRKQMPATCDFKTSFKCPTSTNVRSEVGMFDLEEILNSDEVACYCSNEQPHVLTSADFLKYWNFEKACCEDEISEKYSTESDVEEAEALWSNALRQCYTKLVCDMEPMSILDRFQEIKFLPKASLSDIREFQRTSEKNRALMDKVSAKGEQGYNVFKKCLQNTEENAHLADHLTAVETQIKDTYPLSDFTEQRIPTEEELTKTIPKGLKRSLSN